MLVVENVWSATKAFPNLALTVGTFDGVHLGHQRVLRQLLEIARANDGTAAALTMRPHPREFFTPNHAPNLLTSDQKKLALLEEAGVDVVYVLPFNAATASLDRHEFVERVVRGKCGARHLVVGHDFRFGKNGLGDYDFLLTLERTYGFSVTQVPPLTVNGERVSSTLIRERLLEGDLDDAEAFLGRKYSVTGEVVGGRGIGVTLGFPTANVKPHHTAVPAQGVYAAEVILGGQRYAAAVNVGIAPTIEHEDTVIEAFVLDFSGDLRGSEIEIVFHKRLRPEKKFASREELSHAIAHDVEAIRQYFGGVA